jgi:hypothetical protein
MKQPNQKNYKIIGALQYEFSRVGIYIGAHNFLVLAGTGYLIIKGWLPIPLWLFMLLDVALIFLLMIFDYLYVLPSVLSFTNMQRWEHNNPWRKYMEEMKAEIIEELRKQNRK